MTVFKQIAGQPLWAVPVTLGAVAAVATAGVLAFGSSSAGTQVLGEKLTGSGTGTTGGTTSGASTAASSNGNGNTSGNSNKTFAISGTVAGLYPGGTVHLTLHVANNLSQDMTVNTLSASQGTIVKNGQPATGCTATLTIGTWTGTAFTLPKNTTDMPAPGVIDVTLPHSARDACQGATFNLNYSGTAVQK